MCWSITWTLWRERREGPLRKTNIAAFFIISVYIFSQSVRLTQYVVQMDRTTGPVHLYVTVSFLDVIRLHLTAVRSLGNRDVTFRWFQPNVKVKSINHQCLSLEAKNEKNKGVLFSATSKVWENKVVLLFSILASRPRYWRLVLFTSNHIWLKSPESEVPVP